MFLEGPTRHARSTVRCSFVPAVACILAKARHSLYCTAGWSVVCIASSFHAWQYDCTCSSWCLMRLGCRRLLADEGWRWVPSIKKHRNDSLLLQRCVDHLLAFPQGTREQEIDVPVHSGL